MQTMKWIGKSLLIVALWPLWLTTAEEENAGPEMFLTAKSEPVTIAAPKAQQVPAPAKKQADLVMTSLIWSKPLKEGYGVAQESILKLGLKNQGAGASGNFKVKFTCPGCPPSMSGEKSFNSLAPGAVAGGDWPHTPANGETWAAGTYTLEVVIDPNQTVDDRSRVNNRMLISFTVAAKALVGGSAVPRALPKTPSLSGTSAVVQSTTTLSPLSGTTRTAGLQTMDLPLVGDTGRRMVTMNIATAPSANVQTGRRKVVMNISTAPSANQQAGRRVVVMNVSTDPSLNIQTGRRKVTMNIDVQQP